MAAQLIWTGGWRHSLTRLTTHVLTLLEQDGIKAFDRFARMGSRPLRFSTGTAYRGGNAIALWATAELKGYGSPFWLTFKQAEAAGAHVRRGEKGTLILYADRWKPAEAEPDEPGRLFMRAYTVFNAGQVEGLPASYYTAIKSSAGFDPIPEAEAFVRATGAIVHEGGAGAWYRPSDEHDHHAGPARLRRR